MSNMVDKNRDLQSLAKKAEVILSHNFEVSQAPLIF
jgi:hypothetical protein